MPVPRRSRKPARSTHRNGGTFTSWFRASGITALSSYVGASRDPKRHGASEWKVTLRKGRKSMQTPFSMGAAHTGEPKALDVLSSLVMDAQGYENSMPRGGDVLAHAAEFAHEYGYEDIREAMKVFRAVKALTAKLKKFLGADYAHVLSLEMDV